MGRAFTFHEVVAGGPEVMAHLRKMSEETDARILRRLAKAADREAAATLREYSDRAEAWAEIERRADGLVAKEGKKLAKEAAVQRVLDSPEGRVLWKRYNEGAARGEAGIPAVAPVAKAAPPGPCCAAMREIYQIADDKVAKAASHRVTKEVARAEVFDERPDLYGRHYETCSRG